MTRLYCLKIEQALKDSQISLGHFLKEWLLLSSLVEYDETIYRSKSHADKDRHVLKIREKTNAAPREGGNLPTRKRTLVRACEKIGVVFLVSASFHRNKFRNRDFPKQLCGYHILLTEFPRQSSSMLNTPAMTTTTTTTTSTATSTTNTTATTYYRPAKCGPDNVEQVGHARLGVRAPRPPAAVRLPHFVEGRVRQLHELFHLSVEFRLGEGQVIGYLRA